LVGFRAIPPVKKAVGDERVDMRMEVCRVGAEGLDRGDHPGDGVMLAEDGLEALLHTLKKAERARMPMRRYGELLG
jgi:hypothetical protein